MKFKCSGCGHCCEYFGEMGTLPLLGFEKEQFEKSSIEKNIPISFVPENVCLDKISGKLFCANWGLKASPCPFLDANKKCEIYENRGLICRAYPLNKIPDKNKVCGSNLMLCKSWSCEEIIQLIKTKEQLINFFGDEVVCAREKLDGEIKRINRRLKELQEAKKIDLVVVDFLDFNELEVLDVEDFLKLFDG